ncbi:MAG: acyltransferase family protein, partial [Chitinophagaceae bacterium]|nr:acyltransferase family protein [Chitinophagaceae bacterium]
MIDGKRIHGLDALRAVAMLLGVLLHSAIAYKARAHTNWLHDSEFSNWIFDFLYFILHSFRMPVFFFIAGFFARLLYYKIGEKQFIRHRWKRVGIPFIGAMIFILPISVVPYNIYMFIYRDGIPTDVAIRKAFSKVIGYNGLAHFWFLYDLLFLYFVTIILLRCKRFIFFNRIVVLISNWWQKVSLNKSIWFILASLPIWFCLIPEKGIFVLTDTTIIPDRINNLFFYGYIFGIGWLFHIRNDVFILFSGKCYMFIGIGLILAVMLFYIDWHNHGVYTPAFHLLVKFFASLQIISLIFGFTGLFLRVFKKENAFWKYISDASYWVYLVHLGIVITFQLL